MKQYSNPSRKPMMYGGMTKPKKKMEAGGKATADAKANADIQSRVATGRATAKDKAAMEKQRMEELGRMSIPELRKIANGSDADAMMARSVLRAKGDKAAMPSGDQEPAGKMYGGMAGKKKMAMGGKPMAKDPKTGEMKPTYAMDGKGKMMYGGMAGKKKMMYGGMSKKNK